ncbi:MAG: fumarylacetoacetate hydrolase family protein [Solirubrobacteraceae bacterium]|nr:fumarylacetoacetate hydrolase family protein [Solirubrobacteraceae bacterium]
MKLGRANGEVARWDEDGQRWTTDLGSAPHDVVELLQRPQPATSPAPARGAQPAEPAGLPFQPTSLRGVMISEEHFVRGARTMVKHFMPAPARAVIGTYERVTRRTFPALKPAPRFYEVPAFYFGSHTSIVPDGASVRFPDSTRFRDFELELGAVVTRAWDPDEQGPPTAADVIGAFTVVNDFSARDLQWQDERRSPFSGVVKAKSFATGMAATVVTADEILPRWDRVTGRVRVNGELWCEGSTAGGRFSLDEVIAHIAADERLSPGEVISLGTLPGCCGLELDRFVQPGDEMVLELDGVGTLTNTVAT